MKVFEPSSDRHTRANEKVAVCFKNEKKEKGETR